MTKATDGTSVFNQGRFPWPDRSDSNFCLCMIWSVFLKYLAKMDLILILSKLSGEIGSKTNRFVFHSTIDPILFPEQRLCAGEEVIGSGEIDNRNP